MGYNICMAWQRKNLKLLWEINFPHSIGLYSAHIIVALKVNSGEYKLMGLAPYGNQNIQKIEKN